MARKKNSDKELLIRVRADIRQAQRELQKLVKQLSQTGSNSEKSKRQVDGLGRSFTFLKSAVGAYLTLRIVQQTVRLADAYNVLQTRLKTATKATGDYVEVSRELEAISNRNGVALADTVSLFQNLARVAPELNATTEQMLALTDAVQQLGVIGGSTDAQLSAGLLQFSQGLAAGVFRAEEFNSIVENLPEVAARIAKGLGKTVGELRLAVINGKVLSQDVFNALLKQAPDIAKEFENIPDSVGRSGEAMSNAFSKFLSKLDKAINGTGTIARIARFIAETLDKASTALGGDNAAKSPVEQARERLDLELQKLREAKKLLLDVQADDFSRTDIAKRYGPEFFVASREEIIARVRDTIDAIELMVRARSRQVRDTFFANLDAGKIEIPKAPEKTRKKPTPEEQQAEEKRQATIRKTIEALQLEAATTGLTARQVALYRLELLGASQADLDLAARAIDAQQALAQQNADMEAARAIIERTRTAEEKFAAQIEERNRLYLEGKFGIVGSAEAIENWRRAIVEASTDFEGATQDMGETGKAMFDELTQATHGWSRDFADRLLDGERNFRDFAASMIREIERIALTAAFDPLFAGFGNFVKSKFPVKTKADGGMITGPGTATSDSIPALLSNGEYVVRAAAVQHYGQRFLDEVNAIRRPRFAAGGLVRPFSAPPLRLAGGGPVAAPAAGGGEVRVVIENNGSPKEVADAQVGQTPTGLVVTIVTDDVNRGGPITKSLARTFNLRRGG